MKLEEARIRINYELSYIDIKPYSHNMISIILTLVAKEDGKDAANSLIEEFELEKRGWEKV